MASNVVRLKKLPTINDALAAIDELKRDAEMSRRVVSALGDTIAEQSQATNNRITVLVKELRRLEGMIGAMPDTLTKADLSPVLAALGRLPREFPPFPEIPPFPDPPPAPKLDLTPVLDAIEKVRAPEKWEFTPEFRPDGTISRVTAVKA